MSDTQDRDRIAFVESAIRDATGAAFRLIDLQPVHGGSIHDCYRAHGDRDTYFIKLGGHTCNDMFAAEADGLDALRGASPLYVPELVGHRADATHACLILEHVTLAPLQSAADGERAGEALAVLHADTSAQFGWHRSNFLGRTPLDNRWQAHWPQFLATARFAPLFAAAVAAGHVTLERKGRQLVERLPALFVDDATPASLLHGDLWHGNIGVRPDGTPTVFDPAVFRGDPEFDLAMTGLFGGFPSSFYAAYRRARPPRPGYEIRDRLYRCYHLLNHVVLFGHAYLRETVRQIDWLLACR
ncbi:fructosamine kinase family protein [Nitrogeniibacter mangrovi]|uniref:Fructosamine kinase family protein n=1 Tax=Nitrogeniibacter mangrovi TaxID=2016596 RepID=A0A6C1B0I8_9RHOO|nr:fructosamine kinase family protein [Nitrogeniibacter mangrovi]QID17131.1 fructosamine kinase family protein [Nitrogeniibacter mangrovi]